MERQKFSNQCKKIDSEKHVFSSDIRSYGLGIERHQHTYYQVIVPICGRMELDMDGNYAVVEEGCYALLPPDVIHDFESAPGSRFLVMNADRRLLERSDAARVTMVHEPHVGIISSAATRYLSYFVSAVEHGDFALDDARQRLLSLSGLAIVTHEDPTIETPQSKGIPHTLLNDVRNGQRGSIDALARKHGFSRSVLYRRCKYAYGSSPKQLEMNSRLQKAADLLRNTNESIASIAFEVGYGRSSAFTMAFSKHFGVTPSVFRKDQKLKL